MTPARSHTIAPLPKPYIRKAAKSPCKFCIPGATATNRIWSLLRIAGPINRFVPHELTHEEILQLIDDFAHCAQLAREAGYDGVEVMGSEGYLINEFLTLRTNQRSDQWGGDYRNRMRFAVEVVRAVRERVGNDFIIIYRLSMLDLVEGGGTFAEMVELAQAIEAAGATIINTGIGWHEARIPTIATPVPRGAFSWVTRKLKGHVSLPLVTTNRINDPQVADDILSRGDADMVSMARPFLADAELLSKAQSGRADEINTCIGCNQACLDQIFVGKVTSCLVNPRACHETKMPILPAVQKKIWRWSVRDLLGWRLPLTRRRVGIR